MICLEAIEKFQIDIRTIAQLLEKTDCLVIDGKNIDGEANLVVEAVITLTAYTLEVSDQKANKSPTDWPRWLQRMASPSTGAIV